MNVNVTHLNRKGVLETVSSNHRKWELQAGGPHPLKQRQGLLGPSGSHVSQEMPEAVKS